MNHATTQPVPTGMISVAEAAELRRQIAELTRRLEEALRELAVVKSSKIDWKWGITTAIALVALVLSITNLNLNAGLMQVNTRLGDANENVNQRFDDQDKRLGNIERLLMEGRSQTAVYYPTLYPAVP